MNSFNQISYNNGVLTVNGTQYNIQATGSSKIGTSFSKIQLKENKLIIDNQEIILTEYLAYLTTSNGDILQDKNGNNLLYGE